MSTFDLVGYFFGAGLIIGFLFGIVFMKKDENETRD